MIVNMGQHALQPTPRTVRHRQRLTLQESFNRSRTRLERVRVRLTLIATLVDIVAELITEDLPYSCSTSWNIQESALIGSHIAARRRSQLTVSCKASATEGR